MKAKINLITIWTNDIDIMKNFYNQVLIKEPQNMPWNQRTALFADPDGNIHEIFAGIK